MKWLVFILAVAGLVVTTACSEKEYYDVVDSIVMEGDMVRFSTNVSDLTTRADYSNSDFEGMVFGFCCDDNCTSSAYGNNKVSFVDSVWTSSPVMTWKEFTNGTTMNYWAYAPYNEENSGFTYSGTTSFDFTVPSKQTADTYNADLVVAKGTDINPLTDLNSNGELSLTFSHLLTKLTIRVTLGTEFNTQYGNDISQKSEDDEPSDRTYETDATEDDIENRSWMVNSDGDTVLTTVTNPIASLYVRGTNPTCSVSISDNSPSATVSSTETYADIYAYEIDYDEPFAYSEYAVATYECIIVPQEVGTTYPLSIRAALGYYNYKYDFATTTETSDEYGNISSTTTPETQTFEAGKNYTIDIIISPDSTVATTSSAAKKLSPVTDLGMRDNM